MVPAYFEPDQLFDIKFDPDELHKLAGDDVFAGILADIRQSLSRIFATFKYSFDLTTPDFMISERYLGLCYASLKKGTDYLF